MGGIESSISKLSVGTTTFQSDIHKEDTEDLRKVFNFENNKLQWDQPIIEKREKILDLINGKQNKHQSNKIDHKFSQS